MSQPFRVLISADLPADDRDALVLTLRDHVDLREETRRNVDAETAKLVWETFVAVMDDIGKVGTGAAAIAMLVAKINAWRKQLRQRGVEPNARLERPNQPPLDLATATDAQIQAWLIQSPPER